MALPIVGAAGSQQPDDRTMQGGTSEPIDGSLANCTDFVLDLLLFDINIPDPGWVWVDPNQKFQDVTGVAMQSKISHTDFPAVHDSHDQNTDILVDPGQEWLLSDVNRNDPDDPRPIDELEMEWEIGTFPTETTSGAPVPERLFPKWAWPNIGDRVWANGHWIFDCGHGIEVDGEDHHRTEIHPARAIASMRDQVGTLAATGTTPVQLIATDLYIHGRAGFVVDILNCGMDIIVSDDPDSCPTKTTPIAEDFEFDIQLPSRPSSNAVLAIDVMDGPGNTIDIAPVLEPVPADNPTAIHVTVPLAGSGVADTETYARKIKAAWVYPSAEQIRHFTVTLNKMDLHEDHDIDPGDCECTFFYMNVDRSPETEWLRMADFAQGNMNDYDDDDFFGDGEMDFVGATWDFFVRNGQPFSVHANGYDQDCLDDHFGDHEFKETIFLDCYLFGDVFTDATGDNDKFVPIDVTFEAPDYGVGAQDIPAEKEVLFPNPTPGGDPIPIIVSEYELEFTIEETLVLLDGADLSASKECAPDPIRSGESVTCTITVENLGPGLPSNVVVSDAFSSPNIAPGDLVMSMPTYTITGGYGVGPLACNVTGDAMFECDVETIPVGGSAVITVEVTPAKGGQLDNNAAVSSDNDPEPSNDEASDSVTVIQVVEIDIRPGDETNPVKVNPNGGGGRIPVAILSTVDFDAPSRVDVSSLTFGRTGNEDSFQRCAPNPEDVNGDGLDDLICQFSNDPRLFQTGDTEGILRGQTLDGPPILIEGRDLVTPVP